MIYLLNVYKAELKVKFALWLQYRAAMIIWMIGLVITPLVYLMVWTTVSNGNGGAVDGISTAQFAGYFISMMVVNQLTYTWIMWEYDYEIRQGRLSPKLLRPFHPIHEDIAENLTYKVLTFMVIIPIALFLSWLFKPSFEATLGQRLAFLLSVLFAFLIQFLSGWTVAILAFWTNRVSAINRIYFLGKLFLSGQMAPLILLPPFLETAATYTPYRWMLSFPVELFMGWAEGALIWQGLLVQLFWVIFMAVLSQLVWRAGIRRYSAVGA